MSQYEFEQLESEVAFEGRIFSAGMVRVRHADGTEVTREKVWHAGAVAILALDRDHVWLTRQPREAAGLKRSLEVPAGKRDVSGEEPLATAKRELGEEIGKRAASWRELKVFYSSAGFSDERVWLYLATELADDPDAEPEAGERIEVVPWPLRELDDAIAQCEDAKTLIALQWLALGRERGTI